MATKEISIVLRAKNAMAAGLSKAWKSVSRFGSGIKNLAQSATKWAKRLTVGFLAAGAVVAGFAAKAIQAYAVQEKAEKSLTSALDARGEKGRELIKIMKKEAAAIQDQTGAADEQTLATMAQLSQLGVLTDNLADAAKATIALKSVGLEGASAQRAVAMAFAGNYSMLQRYVPALRDATTEQEKAIIVSNLFNRGYKQQADELNTVSGQWKNLKGRIGDALEAIGSAIANSDGLQNALRRAADGVKAFGQTVTDWVKGEQFAAIQTSVEGIVNAMTSGGEGRREAIGAVAGLFMAAIKDGGEWVGNHLLNIAPKIGTAIGNAMRDASKAVAQKVGDADAVRKLMRERGQITRMQEMFPNLAGFNKEQKAIYDQLMQGMSNVNKEAKKTEDGIDGQTDAVSRTAKAMAKLNAVAEKHKKITEDTPDSEPIDRPPDVIVPVMEKPTPEEIAANKLKVEKKLADDIKKLEDEKKQAQIAAQQKVLDDAKKKVAEQEKLANMRVQDFIDAAKKEKNIAKEKADEAARAAELQGQVDRGVKLSKRGKEFLDAFNAIKAANDPQGGLAMAKNDAKLAQEALQAIQGDQLRALQDIDVQLTKQRKELKQLLTMQ